MKKIFVIILLIFLISCTKNLNKNVKEIAIGNGVKLIKINAEIADDNEERMKGLMFRERLDKNSGMLFVFDSENYQTFWMKNTLIPLDIIFIDKNFKIINIENAVPCNQETCMRERFACSRSAPCTLYKSAKPAEYVLEVNGNFTIRNKIKAGDTVIIS